MARDRAIVDVVTRITPPIETKPTQEAVEANREGFLIEFRGGETARVMPGPLAAAYLDLLEDLRRQGNPVYVTVAAEGGAVTDLMIPRVMKPVDVRETGRGEVEVEFFPSHARHTLKRDSEAFKALLDALASGDRDDGWLVVTETDRHEIIDVRPFRGDGGPPLPRPPGRLAALTALVVHTWLFQAARWWTYKLCVWFCCPPRFTCCVSLGTAWRMFDLCAARSCVPVDPQPPCIPFLYPDDGCWARAHEMCRLMIASGVKPAKVWIDGSLTAATKNNPYCAVHWGWHVAPTLCVRTFWCLKRTYVIDPSLFTGPVTVATWKSVQGDPSAVLTHTSASVYWRNWMPTDPNYVDTNIRLTTYRNFLKHRSTIALNPNTNQPWGPPPYAHC